MQATLEKKDETFAQLKITIEEADYSDQVNQRLKEYQKQATLKGFRPGKVPMGMVKQMVGDNIKAEEVLQALSRNVQQYINDNDIQVIGEPLPSEGETEKTFDWKNTSSFDFSYDLGIIPTFELIEPATLEVPKFEIEVTDQTLEETLENIIKNNAAVSKPEVAEEADILTGELSQGDFIRKTSLNLAQIAATPRKKFIGAKIGDKVSFDLQKAYAKAKKELKFVTGLDKPESDNLEGDFDFEITEISRTQDAELSQDFFDKIVGEGKVSNEEEYKAEIKKLIAENYGNDSNMYLAKSIKDAYVVATKINFSEEFLKKWILDANKGSISTEDLEKDFDKYVIEFKWNLIKNKIASESEIKVEYSEVQDVNYFNMINQFGGGQQLPPELEAQMREYANKQLTQDKGQTYMRIADQVLNNKVVDFVKDKVSLQHESITSEAFKEKVSAE